MKDRVKLEMLQKQLVDVQTQIEMIRSRQHSRRKEFRKSSSRRSSKGSNIMPMAEKKSRSRPQKEFEVREITFDEKKELSEAINLLSGDKLSRVVQIIHESMPHLQVGH